MEDPATRLEKAIQAVVPPEWSVVGLNRGALPDGHYWGEDYVGERGAELVLQGPTPVYFVWQDRDGVLHRDALAREALSLYVMPSTYRQDSFKFKGPIPARLLWEGRSAKIYAMPSSRILDSRAYDDLVKVAQSTDWPESPRRTGQLSWAGWKRDVKRLIERTFD